MYDQIYLEGKVFATINKCGLKITATLTDRAHITISYRRIHVSTMSMIPSSITYTLATLALVLWGYWNRGPPDKYGTTGILCRNIHTHFFDDVTVLDIGVDIVPMGLRWSANSCYVDAVLMCMLFSANDHIRTAVFDTSTIDYTPYWAYICDSKSTLTSADMPTIAHSIQSGLRKVYKRLLRGDQGGYDIRQHLVKCSRKYTPGRTHQSTELYATLCHLFPALLLTTHTLVAGHVINTSKTAFATVTSFCEHDDTSEILWDAYDQDVLVLCTTDNKYTDLFGEGQGKVRTLGTTVLDGSYVLTGVVLHKVNHFISYFTLPHGQVVRYDDMNPTLTCVNTYPPEVGIRTSTSIPVLYMYKKVSIYKGFSVRIIPRPSGKVIVRVADVVSTTSAQIIRDMGYIQSKKGYYKIVVPDHVKVTKQQLRDL